MTSDSGFGGGFGDEPPRPDHGADAAIAVGDVVTLKSGGPNMTVRAITGDMAECEWFDGAEHRERSFKALVLRPISIADDPTKIFDKMSEAARGVFDELKERAKGFSR